MPSSTAAMPPIGFRPTLIARLSMLALILAADKIFLNTFVDFDLAQNARGVGAFLRDTQHWAFRFVVACGAAAALFAYVRGGTALRTAGESMRAAPMRSSWLFAHLALIALLALLSHALFRATPSELSVAAVAAAWTLAAAAAILTAMRGLAPFPVWLELARSLGAIWVYAVMAALLGIAAMQASQHVWTATASLTYDLVRRVLTPLLPTLTADPSTLVLRTDRFAIQVAEVCSGLEGVGLVLAFTAAWLIYFRREYRFPQALLLIPLGMGIIYLFNVLRIAAFVMIGDAGHPDVAVYGFHSQAGWIAFNAVSCGLVYLSRRSRWLNRNAAQPQESHSAAENPTATYLMPLLAILAAGLLSKTLSSGFEVLDPLRLLAAVVALWVNRKALLRLDWRCSWRGVLVGVCVFAVWIGTASRLIPAAGIPVELAAMMPAGRGSWLACRLVAFVLTVPIAEELAYRGFLMRRIAARDFEALPYAAVRWPALSAAALLFGAMHGALWAPATIAGLAYGVLLVRRGHLGEAVLAHATTNALLAATVIGWHQWQYW